MMERFSLEELRCFRTKLAQQFASPVYGKNPSASKEEMNSEEQREIRKYM